MRGLLIGRFQPFHRGHLAVVTELRARRPTEELLIGIGSSETSFTPENPFTGGERFEMIERALAEARITSYHPVPIPDIHRHSVWVAHVASLLPKFERVYTNNPLTRELFEGAGYDVEGTQLHDRARFEGTKVRGALAHDRSWTDLVPEGVARYLDEIHGPDRLRMLGDPAPHGSAGGP